jgi:hypothetical protein
LETACYYAKNSKPGATTITITLSGTPAFGETFAEEWSGLDPSNPLDQHVGTTGTSTTPSSGNVTTTSPVELVYGYIIPNSGTLTAGSGFTVATQPVADLSEYSVVTTTGSVAATGTMGTNTVWTAQVMTFKASRSRNLMMMGVGGS